MQLKQKDSANKNYGGCLENRDPLRPLRPLRPQNLKRKTPFYILVLSFYFISHESFFILYSIVYLIPHNRGFSWWDTPARLINSALLIYKRFHSRVSVSIPFYWIQKYNNFLPVISFNVIFLSFLLKFNLSILIITGHANRNFHAHKEIIKQYNMSQRPDKTSPWTQTHMNRNTDKNYEVCLQITSRFGLAKVIVRVKRTRVLENISDILTVSSPFTLFHYVLNKIFYNG